MTYEKTFRVEMMVRVVGNEELTDMDPGKVANAIRFVMGHGTIIVDDIHVLPPNPRAVGYGWYGMPPLLFALETWHRELHEVKP